MKTKLTKLEARLQELIEVRMAGILPSAKIEKSLIQRLAAAMQNNVIEHDGVKTGPNIFTLIVPPDEITKWQNAQLLEALKETLQTVGREMELEFAASPTLSVATEASLSPGEVRVVASREIDSLGSTDVVIQRPTQETDENKIPENAFLIIDGRKVFPLKEPVINIGRRLENHLAIDDPRVSRTHAQLRAIKGRYILFDLNSTGGTFINGQRIAQSILYPGDVISLAGVTLIFGQDNLPPRLDLKETGPLDAEGDDRTTAILKHSNTIRLEK